MSIQNLETYGNFTFYGILFNRTLRVLFAVFCNIFAISRFVDPFTDAAKGVDESSKQDQPLHIRIQQRSGRKTLTTVQGISDHYDKKKLVKAFKKVRILNWLQDLCSVAVEVEQDLVFLR